MGPFQTASSHFINNNGESSPNYLPHTDETFLMERTSCDPAPHLILENRFKLEKNLNQCVLHFQKALEWKKRTVLVNRNIITQGCDFLFRFLLFASILVYLTTLTQILRFYYIQLCNYTFLFRFLLFASILVYLTTLTQILRFLLY